MSLLLLFRRDGSGVVLPAGDSYQGARTWSNSLYKPMNYDPLRYAPMAYDPMAYDPLRYQPARWKPPRYKKPF